MVSKGEGEEAFGATATTAANRARSTATGNQHLSLHFGYLVKLHVRCKSSSPARRVWAGSGCDCNGDRCCLRCVLAATACPICQFRPDCTQLMNHFTASLALSLFRLTPAWRPCVAQINYAHLEHSHSGFVDVRSQQSMVLHVGVLIFGLLC